MYISTVWYKTYISRNCMHHYVTMLTVTEGIVNTCKGVKNKQEWKLSLSMIIIIIIVTNIIIIIIITTIITTTDIIISSKSTSPLHPFSLVCELNLYNWIDYYNNVKKNDGSHDNKDSNDYSDDNDDDDVVITMIWMIIMMMIIVTLSLTCPNQIHNDDD